MNSNWWRTDELSANCDELRALMNSDDPRWTVMNCDGIPNRTRTAYPELPRLSCPQPFYRCYDASMTFHPRVWRVGICPSPVWACFRQTSEVPAPDRPSGGYCDLCYCCSNRDIPRDGKRTEVRIFGKKILMITAAGSKYGVESYGGRLVDE